MAVEFRGKEEGMEKSYRASVGFSLCDSPTTRPTRLASRNSTRILYHTQPIQSPPSLQATD